MSRIVVLDSGPAGLMTNPYGRSEAKACYDWMKALLANGTRVVLPAMVDYEVRRELLRARRLQGIERLNGLRTTVEYIPLKDEALLLAADFWAEIRNLGRPTADDKALDADMILVAQSRLLAAPADAVIIATTNPKHLTHFADARAWADIPVSA